MNSEYIRRRSGAATTNEEPELAFEESIPLDGDDPVGQKMIEELGQLKESLKDPTGPAEGQPIPKQFPAS